MQEAKTSNLAILGRDTLADKGFSNCDACSKCPFSFCSTQRTNFQFEGRMSPCHEGLSTSYVASLGNSAFSACAVDRKC